MAETVWGMNIPKEMKEEVKPQSAPTGAIDSGVYDAEIRNAYIRKTDSGAEMAEFELFLPQIDRTLYYATAVQSKAGKNTYEREGKTHLLPGVQELINLFRLTTGSDEIKGSVEHVKHRDQNIEALVLKPLIGKKVKVGIRQEENVYNGETSIRNVVYRWMTPAGENSAGENIEEKVLGFLKRNPLKKAKNKPGITPTPSPDVEALSKAGW